jgi:UDP-glucose 4-epimerase
LGKGDSDANTVEFAVGALRRFAFDCASHGVERMVFASSAAVYGTDSDTPRCEDDEVHADSPYAELKLRSEHALQDISGSTTLSALSLRIFNV